MDPVFQILPSTVIWGARWRGIQQEQRRRINRQRRTPAKEVAGEW
jgi:hypothetical protein